MVAAIDGVEKLVPDPIVVPPIMLLNQLIVAPALGVAVKVTEPVPQRVPPVEAVHY